MRTSRWLSGLSLERSSSRLPLSLLVVHATDVDTNGFEGPLCPTISVAVAPHGLALLPNQRLIVSHELPLLVYGLGLKPDLELLLDVF